MELNTTLLLLLFSLDILKIIRTVVQLFTSVDKTNYKVNRLFNKNKFSSLLRLDS